METVDFAEVSDKHVMFMCKQGSTEYIITLYARSAGALNQFYYSEAVSYVPSALVGDMLYVAADGSVDVLGGRVKLELDYEQGGKFDSLKATAVKQLGNVTRRWASASRAAKEEGQEEE